MRFRWSGRHNSQGRASLTEQEVAEREQVEKEQAAKRLAGLEGAAVGRRSVAESPIRGNEYNSFWQDHGRPRQISTRTVSHRRSARRAAAVHARRVEGRSARLRPLRSRAFRVVSGPGHRRALPHRRCHRHDVAGTERRPQSNRAESRIRHDPPRGIPRSPCHPGRPVGHRRGYGGHGIIRQWFGDAIGRWEGDTLVVDTTNFIDRTNYEWANVWTRPSESLHLVERFKRVDATTIEYTITVEDPTTFTRPWTAVIPISKLSDDTQIYEYACHEGNYAMPNLLRGGRTDAARTSSK